MNCRISRRTLLRGAGAAIALPWLEERAVAADRPPKRIVFVYIPNGVVQDAWTPAAEGTSFVLPSSLSPLTPVRESILVLSHLDRTFVTGTGVHAQASACWLTSSPPTELLDGGFPTNVSLDQMIAGAAGGQTPFPSLELSCNDHADNKETRYFEAVSWSGPGYANSIEKNPRAVFQRLFGLANRGGERSVLDAVRADALRLQRSLGREDRTKVEEYLESVRGIESRIQRSERLAAARKPAPFAAPEGIPEDRRAYIRLMFDLVAVAFQADLTRVASVVIDPERWDSPRDYPGVFDRPENHHVLTHAKGPEPLEKLKRIDHFHVAQFAYLVEKLKGIREGERSLLDSGMAVLGSGLGDGSMHSYKDLPLVAAGSLGGAFLTGRHVAFPWHPAGELLAVSRPKHGRLAEPLR